MWNQKIQVFCQELRSTEVNAGVTKPHRDICMVSSRSVRQSNVNHLPLSLRSTRSARGTAESFQEHFKVFFAAVPVA